MDLQNVSNSFIPGKAAADKMTIRIGDVLTLTSNKGIHLPLKVVSLFQSG